MALGAAASTQSTGKEKRTHNKTGAGFTVYTCTRVATPQRAPEAAHHHACNNSNRLDELQVPGFHQRLDAPVAHAHDVAVGNGNGGRCFRTGWRGEEVWRKNMHTATPGATKQQALYQVRWPSSMERGVKQRYVRRPNARNCGRFHGRRGFASPPNRQNRRL